MNMAGQHVQANCKHLFFDWFGHVQPLNYSQYHYLSFEAIEDIWLKDVMRRKCC